MKTRICKSAPRATGCSRKLPMDAFRVVSKYSRDSVCIECRNKARRTTKVITITPEIFNQYDELMRMI